MSSRRSLRSRRAAGAALAAAALALAAGPAPAQSPVKPVSGRGQIRGEVKDALGNPLVGISIVLSPAGRDDLLYATSTDEKGRYAMNGLVPDTYRVHADGQGFEPDVKEKIRVKPPFRAITHLKLDAGPPAAAAPEEAAEAAGAGTIGLLRGTFLDARGEPVLEGSVQLRRAGHAGDSFYARTDRDGNFSIQNVPAGLYDIKTRSPGLIPLHLRARRLPAEDSLHLQLVAPQYPLSFKGWIDDLLPREVPVPPPSPRRVEMSLVPPPGEAGAGEASGPGEIAEADAATGVEPPGEPAAVPPEPAEEPDAAAGEEAGGGGGGGGAGAGGGGDDPPEEPDPEPPSRQEGGSSS